jgi:hypothetical protein
MVRDVGTFRVRIPDIPLDLAGDAFRESFRADIEQEIERLALPECEDLLTPGAMRCVMNGIAAIVADPKEDENLLWRARCDDLVRRLLDVGVTSLESATVRWSQSELIDRGALYDWWHGGGLASEQFGLRMGLGTAQYFAPYAEPDYPSLFSRLVEVLNALHSREPSTKLLERFCGRYSAGQWEASELQRRFFLLPSVWLTRVASCG